ncbi:hypothetical protein [Albimonas pacifica]|uniref:Uncharacterized protein n=1 Tax=Albimonas pacifica TaxID=1114924 RepID=A0A1I3KV48_9RHOB|nr:hypothetical protein [Albimonas pacifica]SFI76411.1 hypothetical protein SAMN05216258_109101 [Albimonas pacifica]
MRAQTNLRDGDDRRAELEDAVFDVLGEVYELPPEQAVGAAAFVAGQIAAFLADVARLNGDPDEAERARRALQDLSETCCELLEETGGASVTAARALARIEAIGARVRSEPRVAGLPTPIEARFD